MIVYRLVKTLGPGLIGVDSEWGRQVFTERTLRKPSQCASCGVELPKGARAYGPLDNGMNRMHRVHRECIRSTNEKVR